MNDDLDLITKRCDPESWNSLLHQLTEAHVHLGELIKQMDADSQIDEIELGVILGHVYGHLNRAWNGRRLSGCSPDDWYSEENCSFPQDIQIT